MNLTFRCTLTAGVPPQYVRELPPPLVLLKLFQRSELGFGFNPRVCAAISESSYRQPPSLLFWCQEWLVCSVQWLVKIWGWCTLPTYIRLTPGRVHTGTSSSDNRAKRFWGWRGQPFPKPFSVGDRAIKCIIGPLKVCSKYLRHGSYLTSYRGESIEKASINAI